MNRRRWDRERQLLEFVLLFVGVPTLLYSLRRDFAPFLIPILGVVGVGCLVVLLRDPRFDRGRLWSTADLRAHLRRSLRLFLPGAAVLMGLLAAYEPERLLNFPLSEPWGWLVVVALYPVLSAWPQEVIYRAFLFHRYPALLTTDGARIAASALAFGLAHLFLGTWIAVGMSTVGGWLFARTYARSGSVLAATLEHAAWGNALFTLGWGWYFWSGSVA